jgi:hypothetical protein
MKRRTAPEGTAQPGTASVAIRPVRWAAWGAMPLVPEPEGILGGLEAYLAYMGVDSGAELEPIEAQGQLSLDLEDYVEIAA